MISWILLLNSVIDSATLEDAMIYFQSFLPWCLILTGILLRNKTQYHKTR